MITVDANKLQLTMDVSDEELAKRKAAWKPPPPNAPRQGIPSKAQNHMNPRIVIYPCAMKFPIFRYMDRNNSFKVHLGCPVVPLFPFFFLGGGLGFAEKGTLFFTPMSCSPQGYIYIYT